MIILYLFKMAKKRTKSNISVDSDKIYFLIKKRIFIYPIIGWFIEVNYNGNIKTFDKRIRDDEIQEAIAKTILYYYNKLK